MRKQSIFLILASAVIACTALAQEEPVQSQPAATATNSPTSSAVINPARGSTMESVRAKFGAPSQELPAVGKPPITRWEYPGFVVFFENDRVLHTVVVKG